MRFTFKTGMEYINKLRMIAYSFLAAPLAVFVALYLKTGKAETLNPLLPPDMVFPVSFGLFILYVGLLVYSYIFYAMRIKGARSEQPLRQKLRKYAAIAVIRLFYLEMATAACLAGAFVAGQKAFLALFVVLLFIFSIENPSLYRVARQLRLTKAEKDTLFSVDGVD